MELWHLWPWTASHRNGSQELAATTSRITAQDHHIFQPSQPTILENATTNILKSHKGSIGIIWIWLQDKTCSRKAKWPGQCPIMMTRLQHQRKWQYQHNGTTGPSFHQGNNNGKSPTTTVDRVIRGNGTNRSGIHSKQDHLETMDWCTPAEEDWWYLV